MWKRFALVLLAVAALLPSGNADGYAPPFNCTLSTNKLTDANREKALKGHNDLRKNVVEGNVEFNTNQGWLPKAQNMYKLKYSCELELEADRQVRGCPGAPNPVPDGTNYKEFAAAAQKTPLEDAIEEWSKEIDNKVWPQYNKYDKATSGDIREFSQMITAKTIEVGCSEESCQGGNPVAACVYKPALADGDTVYLDGQPCAAATDCTTYPDSTCEAPLCLVPQPTTPAPTTTTPTTPSTTTPASTMPTQGNQANNQMCPQNVGMNDEMRRKALDMHNYRRGLLAGGQVAKNNGNFLPKGSNIRRLTYDCRLEKEAKDFTNQCTVTGTNSQIGGVGENFYRTTVAAAGNRLVAIQEGIKYWWSRVRTETTNIGMAVTFKAHHVGQPIAWFTMMAWHSTTNLGCAASRCDPYINLVCRYNPGGNIVNQVVYSTGNPCSRCPAGTSCIGNLCA